MLVYIIIVMEVIELTGFQLYTLKMLHKTMRFRRITWIMQIKYNLFRNQQELDSHLRLGKSLRQYGWDIVVTYCIVVCWQ